MRCQPSYDRLLTSCATHRRSIWECVDEVLPLKAAEQRAIEVALEARHGNRTAAAQTLGVSVRTLYNKLHPHA